MPRRGRHLCTEATAHVKGEKESFQEVCRGREGLRGKAREKGAMEAEGGSGITSQAHQNDSSS